MIDSYGLRLRLPREGLEDKADGVLVYSLSDTDHQLGKKKKLRLNIPPGKYCTIVPVKCKLSFCFSTSAEEYQAKMPQYFFIWTAACASVEYDSHVSHVSTNYLYIVCVT